MKGRSRREFLASGGKVVAGAAMASVAMNKIYAGEDNTIHLALVGCGGRGGGAAGNAMSSKHGPVKLVAMADVFKDKQDRSYQALKDRFGDRVDVPETRRFLGFDAYKKAVDCLRPGKDIMIQATHAAFRPLHVTHAVDKGVNVFMEKSFAPDPGGTKKILAAAKKAKAKNVKIGCGLMCRHSASRQALIEKIRDGALGEIPLVRAYRMDGGARLGAFKGGESELLWQIRNFTKFLWVSGGLFAEMDIHQIDELCWVKGTLPVTAHGIGGRADGSSDCSQNLDSFSIEWTFPDGTKATDAVRYLGNCYNHFATYIHGTKCAAQFSGNIHAGTVRIFKDQRIDKDNIVWEAPKEKLTPWQAEWNVLLKAIRHDLPHNEARRAAESNLADLMGRAAVHSGQLVTWDETANSNFQFCSNTDTMDYDTIPPIEPDADGKYPVPVPGQWTEL